MSNNRSEIIDRLPRVFKALSNEHRLRIYMRLIECCPAGTRCEVVGRFTRCISQLGEDLGIAASTLSHHMKELRQAGLIHTERCGQKVQCRVDTELLSELTEFFNVLNGIEPELRYVKFLKGKINERTEQQSELLRQRR